MAEIGLIASVIQVAGAGLTLSKALYQYADSVSSADKRVRDIAQDVKLTSFVIDELGHIFKQDETAALISKNAVNTAEETVRECSNVFTEMEAALKRSKKNTLGRLMLPFREPKLELLRTNIDRLKSTLQLLMQVLTHARQITAQKPDKEVVAVQRQQIKVLIQTKKESTKRYEESLRNYGSRAMKNDDDLSAEINDEKNETSDRSISMFKTASSIGTTITAKGLESCVEHIQKLLKDIEAVQRALSANIDSTSSTEHEQGLIGSYFRTRSALDSVILGSSSAAKADSGLGEVTLPKIGHLSSASIEEEREERVRLKKTQTYSNGPEPDPKFDEEKKPLAEKINEEAALLGAVTAAGDLDMDTFIDFNVGLLPHRLQIDSVSEKSYLGFKQQTGLPPASQVFDPTEEEQYRARGVAEEELLESKKRSGGMSAQISVRTEEKPLAIKFKDAIGRKFSFPFELCKTWKTIEELINQAFLHVDVIGEHVQQGRYDLVGPEGEVILPQLWETVIEPGWEIKMHMWLIPGQPSQSLGPHSRPPQTPQPLDMTSPLVVVTTPLTKKKAKKARGPVHPLYMYGSGPRSRWLSSALQQDTGLVDTTAYPVSAKQDQEALAGQGLRYDEDYYESQNNHESDNYYDNGLSDSEDFSDFTMRSNMARAADMDYYGRGDERQNSNIQAHTPAMSSRRAEIEAKREKSNAMRDEREKRHQDQGARVEALNQDISPLRLPSTVTLAGETSESDQKIDTLTTFDTTYEAPTTDTKYTDDITTPPEPQTAPPPTSFARLNSGPTPPPWPSRRPRPRRNPATSSTTPTPHSPPPPPPSWAVPTSLTISNFPATLTEDQLDDLLTDQKLPLPRIYEHQQSHQSAYPPSVVPAPLPPGRSAYMPPAPPPLPVPPGSASSPADDWGNIPARYPSAAQSYSRYSHTPDSDLSRQNTRPSLPSYDTDHSSRHNSQNRIERYPSSSSQSSNQLPPTPPAPPHRSPQRTDTVGRRPLPPPPPQESGSDDYFSQPNGNNYVNQDELFDQIENIINVAGNNPGAASHSPSIQINQRPVNGNESQLSYHAPLDQHGSGHRNGGTINGHLSPYLAQENYNTSDESDIEAAAGLAAMQMAEAQEEADEARRRSGGSGLFSSYTSQQPVQQYSTLEVNNEQQTSASDSDYVPVDMGLYGGSYEPHFSYGGGPNQLAAGSSSLENHSQPVSSSGSQRRSKAASDADAYDYPTDPIHPFPPFSANATFGTGGLSEPSAIRQRLSYDEGDEITLTDTQTAAAGEPPDMFYHPGMSVRRPLPPPPASEQRRYHRHEREVHKLHGGTKKSFFCPHGDCKRSSGSGFTRKENLTGHIRRVHRRVSASSDTGLSSLKREDGRDEVAQVELIAKERSEPPRAMAKSKEEWTRKDSEKERERERERELAMARARAKVERARAEKRQMTRVRAEEVANARAEEMARKGEWMRKDGERESNSDKDDDVDELLHKWTTLYTV